MTDEAIRLTDEPVRLGNETALTYLRWFALLLFCVGVAVVVMAARRTFQESRGRMTPRRNDRAALAWIWSTFAVTFWAFSYLVISGKPKGGYADLFGPSWITTPILLAVQLALPLLVLVIGSVAERTSSRVVTKLSALVLLYFHGAFVVDATTVPLDLAPALESPRSHLVGPRVLGALIAGAFVLEYLLTRVAPRVGRAVGSRVE
jgi:uncharacterized membrane protein YoaK (UPF0700 family)